MNANVSWYFDFVSPFSYLQWQQVKAMKDGQIEYRPLLFAALLNHHGHKGPGEIPDKRLFSYRHIQWRADRAGIALRFPPAHPFNPLSALRLCVAAGTTASAIDTIFNFIWRDGMAADTPEGVEMLAQALGIADPTSALADPAIKATLQHNFTRALEDGIFGVPSLVVDSQVFWGEDATPMFLDYLGNRALFDTPAMQRLASLPLGATRKAAQ